ncbi:alpha/beta-hydrolase [Myriangium duriaei CBS 260.36]|uniref:Acyl-protein thioesterase 1 n=1 Tax=Myriangium duriaei CBS 260.36 TaxID=1168546 RepID=A0A9P4IXY8_9PEZI|nr:alpha/beta-hydrolase [Myriangium duriaei CBS 260.36]
MAPAYDAIPVLHKPAISPPSDPAHGAALVFLHGLGDTGQGWEDIPNQFQRASKHPHLSWHLPTAPENRDAMQTAWYMPTSLSPPPAGRPELADEEDVDGLLATVAYVESLLDSLTSKGVPPERIVLAGFSQGCAVSLLTSLISRKYAGKLAGTVGLMGYLPIPEEIQGLRAKNELPATVGAIPVFLARGGADRLIPGSKWRETVAGLKKLGVDEGTLEINEYEGLGHLVNGPLLKDLDAWLEKVVPRLE